MQLEGCGGPLGRLSCPSCPALSYGAREATAQPLLAGQCRATGDKLSLVLFSSSPKVFAFAAFHPENCTV